MQETIVIVENGADKGALDMFPTERVRLNLQLNTVGDIANRNSTFSNTIKVPRTSKNEQLLQNVGSLYNQSRIPYTQVNCRYKRGNTFLIPNGTLKVARVTPKTYELILFDGVIGLNAALEGLNIQDLSYSDLNHIYNEIEWENSQLYTEGYIYPFGDYGLQVQVNYDITEQAPAVFAHTIWEKIFQTIGFTYSGDFFDTNTDWKELVVSSGRWDGYIESTPTITDRGSGDTDVVTINKTYSGMATVTRDHDFNNATDTFNATYLTIGADGNLDIQTTGTYQFNVDITYTKNTYTRVDLKYYVNGVKNQQRGYVGASPISDSFTITLNAGDEVRFEVVGSTIENWQGDPLHEYIIDFSSDVSLQVNQIEGGTFVEVGNWIPDMDAKDFVKDIMQKFGLVAIKNNSLNNDYLFIQLETLLNDRLNSYDWTDKLIDIKRMEFDSGYSQRNNFRYNYLNTENAPQDGALLVDNVNLPVEKDVLTSGFTIADRTLESIITDSYGNYRLYSVPMIVQNDDLTIEYEEVEPRIFRVISDTRSQTIDFFGTTNSVSPCTFLSLENVGWQYFLDTYYVAFKNLLDDFVRVDVEVYLTDYELYSLDLFRLVYLKQTGRYYYIEKVRTGKTTTATLVEIRTFNA